MRRDVLVAVKLVGMFALGGMFVAAGLLLLSVVLPVRPDALRIGMAVTVATFTVMGLVVSLRYLLGALRRSEPRRPGPTR